MKVLKNTTAYMAASLLPNAVNFFMLPVYTRFLTPADFGILAMVTALTSFLVPFLGLQLAESLRRSFFEHDERGVRLLFSTILYSMLVINVGILLLVHMVRHWIMAVAFTTVDVPYHPHVMIALATVFVQSVVNLCNLMLQIQQKGGTILLMAATRTVINVIAGVICVVGLRMGVVGILLGRLGSVVLVSLPLLWVLRSHLVLKFRRQFLGAGLHYSLPMIPHVLGSVVFMYSDKLILGYFLPLSAVGLYEIANRIAMIMKQIVVSFDRAITPVFMQAATRSREDAATAFGAIITKWMMGAWFTFLCFSLFAEELLLFLAPPEYRGAYGLIPILTGAFVFRGLYQFAVKPVLFEKKTLFVPFITVTAGTLNVLGNILFIPVLGVQAAAWTTLLACAVTFLLALVFSRACFRLVFHWGRLLRISVLGAAALSVPLMLRTGGLWGNVALKVASLGVFVLVVLAWNDCGIRADLSQVWRSVVCRVARRDARLTPEQ